MKKYDTLLNTAKWIVILFASLAILAVIQLNINVHENAEYNDALTLAIEHADADSIVTFEGQMMTIEYAKTLYK